MGGVPRRPQTVENQCVEPFKQRPRRGWNLIGVGAIGKVTEAKTKYVEGTMSERQRHDTDTKQPERGRRDPLKRHFRKSSPRDWHCFKGIIESFPNTTLYPLLAIDGEWLPDGKTNWTNVVETVEMIDMVVRVKHGVDNAEPLSKKLRPQVGRRIDKERTLRQSESHTRACPSISGITAGADGASAADDRHTDARASPQKKQFAREISRGQGGKRRTGYRHGEECSRENLLKPSMQRNARSTPHALPATPCGGYISKTDGS
jgi:hypothetical protein